MRVDVEREQIPADHYQEAIESLAALSAWSFLAEDEPRRTIDIMRNYILGLELSYSQDETVERLHEDFVGGLMSHGVQAFDALALSKDMMTRQSLRNIFALSHITEDEPRFGLRVKKHMRYLDEPRFIKAARRLGGY